jgi:predicted SnoaL-like aldol condensation-catalyzing enzyme
MTDAFETNKALVLAFYQKALNERDADVADTFLGDRYDQHKPLVEDGPPGLHRYLGWIAANFPDARSEVERVFADEDIVILMSIACARRGRTAMPSSASSGSRTAGSSSTGT